MSISTTELRVILLSVVHKMDYNRATDDHKKLVKVFVLGKDFSYRFQLAAENPFAMPACRMFSLMNCELVTLTTRPRWVNSSSRQWWHFFPTNKTTIHNVSW